LSAGINSLHAKFIALLSYLNAIYASLAIGDTEAQKAAGCGARTSSAERANKIKCFACGDGFVMIDSKWQI